MIVVVVVAMFRRSLVLRVFLERVFLMRLRLVVVNEILGFPERELVWMPFHQ